jgi:hypothetical protein
MKAMQELNRRAYSHHRVTAVLAARPLVPKSGGQRPGEPGSFDGYSVKPGILLSPYIYSPPYKIILIKSFIYDVTKNSINIS